MLKIELRETSRGNRVRALMRQPRGLRPIVADAIRQAVRAYATGQLQPANLRHRFGSGAFGLYGFRRRTRGYIAKQRRDPNLGGPAAYVGPRRIDVRALIARVEATARATSAPGVLAAASQALTAAAQRGRTPLRQAILRPGTGHRIVVTSGARPTVTITYPAARMLNAHPHYAEQLRDLTRGGARDWRAIVARADRLFDRAIASLKRGTA